MIFDAEALSGVFRSLLEGNFIESIDSFTNDELRPFLPFLISTSFSSSVVDQVVSDKILSRLVVFPSGNTISHYVTQDFNQVEKFIQNKKKTGKTNSLVSANANEKFDICYRLILDDSTSVPSNIITEDVLEDSACIISLMLLNLPNLIPIEKLVLKALAISNGPALLTLIVANVSEILHSVLVILAGVQVNEETPRGRQRASLVSNLVALNPPMSSWLLSSMKIHRRDCLLAARITAMRFSDMDFLLFVQPQLTDKTSCLSQCLHKNSSRHTMVMINERLMKTIQAEVNKSDNTQPHSALLSCVLCLQGIHKLSGADVGLMAGFLTRKVDDDAHLTLALTALLGMHQFSHTQNVTSLVQFVPDPRVAEFLTWLKVRTENGASPTLGHALLYTGICILGGRADHLATYIVGTMRTKLSITVRHMTALKALFLASCLSEADLVKRCAAQPVTRQLNSSAGGRLPIHAVAEMLTTGLFLKQGISITPWIEAQLEECTLPIHAEMVDLLEKYAIESASDARIGLSHAFVQKMFDCELLDETRLASRMLTLLYLLAYRVHGERTSSTAAEIYPNEMYTSIPLRYLLSVVEVRTADFQSIRSSLMRLSTELYPYMLPTLDSVLLAKTKQVGLPISESAYEVTRQLIGNDQRAAMAMIRRMEGAPLPDQVRLLPSLVSAFRATLAPNTWRPLIDAIVSLWSKMENVVPRMLYEKSAVSWLEPEYAKDTSLSDLYRYPVVLFRCDRRILTSPAHFACFIRMIAFFSAASKVKLMRSLYTSTAGSPKTDNERLDRDMLASSMGHAQGALLVQLLVEIVDEKRTKIDGSVECAASVRQALRSIVFEYIHQMFLEDKNLMKLVLFQTLPLHMVQPLVAEVPSMFVVMDYVQEMLSLPVLKRRIFAVVLMVEVARKYRIAASCVSIELVLDVLNTLMRYTNTEANLHLFTQIVPSLAELVKIFPQLSADVTSLLLRVSSLAKSRLALNAMVAQTKTNPERKLLATIQECLAAQINVDSN